MVKSYQPSSLQEALRLKKEMPQLVPYAGGTDLMIKDEEGTAFLFLNKLQELRQLKEDRQYLHIGAACTFTEILASPLAPKLLKAAVSQIAAPAIRNQATSGGNICNGSPKADSALIYYVLDAVLRLVSAEGERLVPINEFYLGRNKTCLGPEELLVEVLVPRKNWDNFYYKKIGARKALAISRVAFAGVLEMREGRVTNFAAAFGAVDNLILRPYNLEKKVLGKTLAEVKGLKPELLEQYAEVINPISGRISAQYRKKVCLNLLSDFVDVCGREDI
jgi:xanthine dehydrogenase FAD-binding subunit